MGAPLLFPTLRGFKKGWIRSDAPAGLALAAIAVPAQMATAHLAGMPEVTGLYAFVAGSLVFALLGRSAQLVVGADSTIAPILAAGVAAIAALGEPRYTNLVSFASLMVGVVLLSVGVFRLGWIAHLLSTPVITGVLGGIGVEILVRQLPAILGISGGGTSTIGRLRTIAEQIGHSNGWSVGIAVGVLATIVASDRLDRRVPGALVGVVVSIAAVVALGLRSHGVAVLGPIRAGLPVFAFPSASWDDVRRLVGPALTIAFVCVAQTAATVRASSSRAPLAADFNMDLFAIGAGSLAAGLSGSFAVDASPPTSQVLRDAGARSQLANLVAATVTLVVALAAGQLLKDLPEATLGAILVFIATRLFRIRELRSISRFDRLEFALSIVTMITVSVFGIEWGVLLAMMLSLADRTRRAARPSDAVLGRAPGTDHWIPPDVGVSTEEVAGVIVYLVYSPLWYGNADYIRSRVLEMVDSSTRPIHAFVIDADGMSDIDYTGTKMMGDLASVLRSRGVTLAIARSSHFVHHELKQSGLLATIGSGRLFATVEEAVANLSAGS